MLLMNVALSTPITAPLATFPHVSMKDIVYNNKYDRLSFHESGFNGHGDCPDPIRLY